eukprot:CAMPEP_0205910030 /NCGR_PEP_ID=MMETSP1325-20131115/4212_1 /ASSEMBLY_ACC=CAM_ASM_000708 /TAXON_ID=236786 /ORGANISM="Florenciella sp., Strain RCC1007" /LENGTH=451 /DNA_ID=CAMNT_0053276359 /DNA_START=73 /DNA_END=1428 /DNA_ORIENTATION=+
MKGTALVVFALVVPEAAVVAFQSSRWHARTFRRQVLDEKHELDLSILDDPFAHVAKVADDEAGDAFDDHARHHSHDGHLHSHGHELQVAELHVPMTVPKVGADMPDTRPDWFRVPAPGGEQTKFNEVKDKVKELGLATVCEEAQCPNIGECWNGGTGTIMLLGDTCTRGCRFCAVKTSSTPPPPDAFEPFSTAKAVSEWGVSYVVLTSVDRDDLPDGGAAHFALTVEMIKRTTPDIRVECLVSDFQGDEASIEALATSPLDVYAHNVETVERLTPFVRDKRAGYVQSLLALAAAKKARPSLYTKTSLMLGLGESDDEVREAIRDIRSVGVDVLTLGQYLRPTEQHLAVVEYVHPDKFDAFKKYALELGYSYVAAGPLVRSSYKAGEFFIEHMIADPDSKPAPPPDAERVAELKARYPQREPIRVHGAMLDEDLDASADHSEEANAAVHETV